MAEPPPGGPEGLEIHVISAATENMVSAEAIYPGAIVTASNGKAIEINNTDAEGRLTLAMLWSTPVALNPMPSLIWPP